MATDERQGESDSGGTSTVGATFGRIHEGLPSDTPWFFRVLLGSRAFLIATVVVTLVLGTIAASNPEWLLAVDQPVSEWFRGLIEDGSFATLVTQLGSPNLAIAFGAIGTVALWRRCRASAITLGLLVASAAATDIALKLIVDRPRPADPVVGTGLGSFPSGHVIHAVVLFGLVPILLWAVTNSGIYLKVGFAVFSVVVVSVAVSRVALGAHWPSDVVASFFIGASLLLVAQFMIRSTWAANRCRKLGFHPEHGTHVG
ncbi:MAG: phosphatase PAP2 family protein [Acidimicrobiia bacterium]|nr:MAG: phosphatase PAP2 family protein [Acidimicrobiia bacterium]